MSNTPDTNSTPQKADKPKSKKKWLVALGLAGGLFALSVLGLRLYFSDAYFKEIVQKELKSALNGREVQIQDFGLSILSGHVTLQGLAAGQCDTRFQDTDLLRIKSADIKIAIWPLLTSGGTNIQALSVVLDQLELFLERGQSGPVIESNVDDLIKRYTGGGDWPVKTGLKSLDGNVKLKNGAIHVRDQTPGQKDWSLDEINLDATLPGLGQAMATHLTFLQKTPDVPQGGSVDLRGSLVALNGSGEFSPDIVKDIDLAGQFNDFDVAHLGRYMDLSRPMLEGKYLGTLGRPVKGTFNLKAASISGGHLQAGIETEGLIAVWDNGKKVADHLPTKISIDAQCRTSGDKLQFWPVTSQLIMAGQSQNLALADPKKQLQISLEVPEPKSGGQDFTLVVKGFLGDIFKTDVGKLLDLEERLGALVDGGVACSYSDSNSVQVSGHLNLKGGEGQTAIPEADLRLDGQIQLDQAQNPVAANLNVQANASFAQIQSKRPVRFTSLDNLEKMTADADLSCKLNGKLFWKTFAPILSMANLDIPVTEKLDGSLLITGKAGQIDVDMKGTLTREDQSPDPIQVSLTTKLDAPTLFGTTNRSDAPYLNFDFQLNSAEGSGLKVQLTGTATRKEAGKKIADLAQRLIFELDSLQANAAIEKAVVQRLQDSGILPKENLLTGDVRLKSQYDHASGMLSLPLIFYKNDKLNLNLVVQDLDLRKWAAIEPTMPWVQRVRMLPAAALRATVTGAAIARLQELNQLPAQKALQGDWSLVASMDPKAATLTVDQAQFVGEAGSVSIVVPTMDLAEIGLFLDAPEKRTAAGHLLSNCTLDVTASPKLFDSLRSLPNIPDDLPVSGQILMKAHYERKADRLFMDVFRFDRLKQTPSPVESLELSFEVAKVADILLVDTQDPYAFLPHLDQGFLLKELRVHPHEAYDYLKSKGNLGGLPKRSPLIGAVDIKGRYQHAGDLLLINGLHYERTQGSGAAIMALDASFVVSGLQKLMKTPPLKLSGYLEHISRGIAVEILKIDPEEVLKDVQSMKLVEGLPNTPPLQGDVETKLHYDPAKDQVVLDSIRYQRREGSQAPLVNLQFGFAISRIGDLLDNIPQSAVDLVPHLNQAFALKQAELAPAATIALLREMNLAPALLADVHAQGTYRPQGNFLIENLKLSPPGEDGIKVSFMAQTPMNVHQPQAGGALSPTPTYRISGKYGFTEQKPLTLLPALDRRVFQGSLNLDQADLLCAAAAPAFVYQKAAGTPAQLDIQAAQLNDGSVEVSSLTLKGGPIGLNLSTAKYNPTPKMVVSMDRFSLLEGPIKLDLKDLLYDEGKDKLRITADIPSINLAQIRKFVAVPGDLTFSGELNQAMLSYDGSLAGLMAGKVGPQDTFALQANAQNIGYTASKGPRSYHVLLNGSVAADSNQAASKALLISLTEERQGSRGQPQSIRLPFQISSRDAGTPLLAALQADGLPLLVKLPISTEGPLNVDAYLEALDALSGPPAPGAKPAGGGAGLKAIRRLRLDTSLKVPELITSGTSLKTVEAPSIVLDNGDLSIPKLDFKIYEGGVSLTNGNYNIASEPIKHSQNLTATALNLRPATFKGPENDETKIFGYLSLIGQLAGQGFSGQERRTWNGNMEITIQDLAIRNSKKSGLANTAKDLVKGALFDAVSSKLGIGGNSPSADLSTFIEHLAFEKFTVNLSIKGGKAVIPRTSLIGTGPSSGFQADFEGGIDLATEALTPPLRIWIIKLSQRMQRAFRMDELLDEERQPFLDKFAQGKFAPLVLDGKSADPKYFNMENLKFTGEMQALTTKINNTIAERKRREEQARRQAEAQKTGEAPAQQPPADQQPPVAQQPPADQQPPAAQQPPKVEGAKTPKKKKKRGLLDELLDEVMKGGE